MRRDIGGFFFLFSIPSHAEAESRAHALAACSLRLVARWALPEGVSSPHVEAGRRRDWLWATRRRVRLLGTVGGARRRQTAMAVSGESVRMRGEESSSQPADGDEVLQMRLSGWSMAVSV